MAQAATSYLPSLYFNTQGPYLSRNVGNSSLQAAYMAPFGAMKVSQQVGVSISA